MQAVKNEIIYSRLKLANGGNEISTQVSQTLKSRSNLELEPRLQLFPLGNKILLRSYF
jgi:hypothetical protein